MSRLGKGNKYAVWAIQDIFEEVNIAIATTNIEEIIDRFTMFRDKYLKNEEITDVADSMYEQFSPDIMRFFHTDLTPEMDEAEYAYDLLGIKLKAMTDIAANIETAAPVVDKTLSYAKLEMLFPDHDVTMLALVVELANHAYSDLFANMLNDNMKDLPKELRPYAKEIAKICEEMEESVDRNVVIADAYKLARLCDSDIDKVTDKEYEWTMDEAMASNYFISWLQQMASTWWFLMLLREEWAIKEGLVNDSNVYQDFVFSDNKQKLIKAIKDAGINPEV